MEKQEERTKQLEQRLRLIEIKLEEQNNQHNQLEIKAEENKNQLEVRIKHLEDQV